MSKTLFIVFKEEDVARLLPLIKNQKNDRVILGLGPSSQERLKKEGLHFKTFEDYRPFTPVGV